MILVDWQIREAIDNEDLIINPLEDDQIGPASVDLTLGNNVIFFKPERFNNGETMPVMINKVNLNKRDYDEDHARNNWHCINPQQFALFHTQETVTLSHILIGQLEGRSSIGRHGLFIHNAGYIDPGFSGQITLELFNATDSPLMLPVGIRICQLIVQACKSPDVPYDRRKGSKYMHQTGVTISRLEEEFK